MSDIVERLREHATDWNGEQMVDGEPAKGDPKAGLLRSAADLITSLRAELERKDAALREIDLDAQRWRAFISSARFKMIGSANFDHSAYPEVSVKADRDPRDWLHFGLEVWDKHRGGDDEQGRHGRNLLMAYVDHRVAAALSAQKEGEA